ncbi:MAG: hypothetical protein JST54_09405 [Deltaproteobacteria bacterium]|nr:hypothetical protein [Deltaproteobacteria bacterium]
MAMFETSPILLLGESPACAGASRALVAQGFPVVRAEDVEGASELAPALVIADADAAREATRWQGAPLILLAQIDHGTLPAVPCAELLSLPLRNELLVGAVKRLLAA